MEKKIISAVVMIPAFHCNPTSPNMMTMKESSRRIPRPLMVIMGKFSHL
ncbi:hypothetical protein M8C21_026330 [Ambrosia artemisiifolia]|uniref:Uncharacterized protein n=1 Tax=Ambrosia artemisiifolia TaxID=4212 RepID=A0AAD5C3U5_AMBAR|nr:hypothetical protein M8C21_026330 [Ambrosia artemisiifolia]